MNQKQVNSVVAGRATFGIEIECFVPVGKIARIGGYHTWRSESRRKTHG